MNMIFFSPSDLSTVIFLCLLSKDSIKWYSDRRCSQDSDVMNSVADNTVLYKCTCDSIDSSGELICRRRKYIKY